MNTKNTFTKTVDETQDYLFDFAPLTNGNGDSNNLATGETLSSFVMTLEDGITEGTGDYVTALANTNTGVKIWLSGGTAETTYTIKCAATTSIGRVIVKRIYIKVSE